MKTIIILLACIACLAGCRSTYKKVEYGGSLEGSVIIDSAKWIRVDSAKNSYQIIYAPIK